MEDSPVDELLKNNLNLQVLTDTGWSDFQGLLIKGVKTTALVKTQHREIVCTLDHKFFSPTFDFIEAAQLKPGSLILSESGVDNVVSVKITSNQPVYDLFKVEKNHRFYANGLLVKNCEFLVFDETLISSLKLADITGKEPIMKMGQCRWYKRVDPKSTYVIALDPSLGTGGDYAAIQVIEIPSFTQVAEWNHNLTPIQGQVRILREICKYISDQCDKKGMQPSIYYSVENNTVGEAALVSISELGEESFPGLFLSEPIRKGHVRRFRKGFNTTHTAKIAVCAKLKQLIETEKLKINSKPLISELKAFVAKGISFEGKVGSHDDLVSSLLLAIRMISMLQDWDPAIYDKMREVHADEDWDLPMPIYISSY
jgi:hypothetical protein